MIFEAPKHWVLPISNIERDVNPNIEQNNGYWVLPGSADAVTWENVHSWGAPHDIPSWMIETSAYANTLDGAIDLSNAMYIALRYGMWAGQCGLICCGLIPLNMSRQRCCSSGLPGKRLKSIAGGMED